MLPSCAGSKARAELAAVKGGKARNHDATRWGESSYRNTSQCPETPLPLQKLRPMCL